MVEDEQCKGQGVRWCIARCEGRVAMREYTKVAPTIDDCRDEAERPKAATRAKY